MTRMNTQRTYIAIDLKSFYASVECQERGLNALTANLVVADESRTEKTICLAVSPALKKMGVSSRPRLFEVVQKVNEINRKRMRENRFSDFEGSSIYADELMNNPRLKVEYEVAPPRMALYMEYSTRIYQIYLQYVSAQDIHVYSIDEVFMDVTHYLKVYKMMPEELASKMICDVYEQTGITATAGIGTNLYLCKVAMDIMAKHAAPDDRGVRIAKLDEYSYRKYLWDHRPLTDFWRVGRGYAKKLEAAGLYTMGDIARCSLGKQNDYYNEDFLYKMFGINAELLIDHAWGYEPVTMEHIKAYKPQSNSIGSGQVLHCPYDFEHAKLVVREMTDLLVLDLVDKRLVTDQLVLTIGYDIENLDNRSREYKGEISIDRYGRRIPKHAHGTANLEKKTSSTILITEAVMQLYDRIVDPKLLIRRINITANKVMDEDKAKENEGYEQMELFTDYTMADEKKSAMDEKIKKERKLQEAMLSVKKRYGKNAMLKGMNLEEGATAIQRNDQIGGHRA